MFQYNFRVGQTVNFSHVDGYVPATILAINEHNVQLQIKNWLGTHWFPINRISEVKHDGH